MWLNLREDISEEFDELVGHWDRKDKECHLRIVSEKNARLAGWERGRPTGTGKNDIREQAMQMLAAGMTQREVAQRLGVNRASLVRWKRAA